MKKQRIARWLILCAVVLLFSCFPFSVFADSPYTVTLTGGEHGYVGICDDPTDNPSAVIPNIVSDGKSVVSVDKVAGARIRLMFAPATGYEASVLKKDGLDFKTKAQFISGETYYYCEWDVDAGAEFAISFTPLQYNISYGGIDNISGWYSWSPETPDQIVGTHTYGTSTYIPQPLRQGYTFKGWSVNGDDSALESELIIGPTRFADSITLTAQWTPNKYNVTREDYRYDYVNGWTQFPESESNPVTWQQDMDSTADGLDQSLGNYVGYEFISDLSSASVATRIEHLNALSQNIDFKDFNKNSEGHTVAYVSKRVSFNEDENVVKWFYLPKEYTISYNLSYVRADSTEVPYGGTYEQKTLHIYDLDTAIADPKWGACYKFLGWTVSWTDAAGEHHDVFHDSDEPLTLEKGAYSGNITLTAKWEPFEYHIDYNTVRGGDNLSSAPKLHTYGVETTLPTLVSTGYTFNGWLLGGTGDPITVLGAEDYTADISLTASWTPNTYTASLDPDNGSEPASASMTYDAMPADVTPPLKKGFTFLGYFDSEGTKYIDADGKGCKNWDKAAESVTLTAKWQRNQYKLTVNGEHIEKIEVSYDPQITRTFSAAGYLGDFDYEAQLTVKITYAAGYKIVKWNAAEVPHSAEYTFTVTVGDADVVCESVSLPAVGTPAAQPDYPNETLTGLTAGTYVLSDGTDTWTVTVDEQGTATSADRAMPLGLSELFGKTLTIVCCGDKLLNADSDAQTVSLVARPAAPTMGSESSNAIGAITPRTDSASIEITVNPGSAYRYEFAYSTSRSADGVQGLTYGDEPLLEGLSAGTPYFIYLRAKATDTHPHGEVLEVPVTTQTVKYLREWIDALEEEFAPYGDGQNVRALIDEAIEKAKNQDTSEDYEQQLDQFAAHVRDNIGFAKVQDDRIAELTEHCNALKATELYNEAGEETLDQLLANATAAICAGESESDVGRIADQAIAAMDAVRITYLSDGDLKLMSSDGMERTANLSASRVASVGDVAGQIRSAITNGTIVPAGVSMTVTEIRSMLDSMDIVGVYQTHLTDTDISGTYELTLVIPEDLRDGTNFRVAYYDNTTEKLTMLDTQREGNQLIFHADHVDNFVIFCDHVVKMAPVVGVLGGILLCQIIALALLLSRRKKYAQAKHNVFLLPAALLAVRFLPEYSFVLAIILGALVLIMQIILTYVIATTAVYYRGKEPSDPEPAPQDDQPSAPAGSAKDDGMTQEDAEAAESEPVLTTLTEEEIPEGEQYRDVDEADPNFSYQEDTDSELAQATARAAEDWYVSDDSALSEEDFIEPAANPKYSLSDMEDADAWETAERDDPDADSEETAEVFADAGELPESDAWVDQQMTLDTDRADPSAWDGTSYDSDEPVAQTVEPSAPQETAEPDPDPADASVDYEQLSLGSVPERPIQQDEPVDEEDSLAALFEETEKE